MGPLASQFRVDNRIQGSSNATVRWFRINSIKLIAINLLSDVSHGNVVNTSTLMLCRRALVSSGRKISVCLPLTSDDGIVSRSDSMATCAHWLASRGDCSKQNRHECADGILSQSDHQFPKKNSTFLRRIRMQITRLVILQSNGI